MVKTKKKLKKENVKAAKVKSSGKDKAVKAKVKGKRIRGRVTRQDKIAKRLSKAGTSSVDVKKALYNVEATDVNATVEYEGQLLKDVGSHVIFRHKKSRGGSRMRVSHFMASNIVSLYGSEGEAAVITVRQPKIIGRAHGTLSYEKDVLLVTSDVTGEVTRFRLSQPNVIVNAFVDEETTSRGKRKKDKVKSKSKKKVDDEDFTD